MINKKKTKVVFGCSPYRGKINRNIWKARKYARFISLCGYSPVMPQLSFPQFLDDYDPEERIRSIEFAIAQMERCDEIWIFGTNISKGMQYEIEKAKDMNIAVRLFDKDCKVINPETLMIDDRVTDEFREIIDGLRFA
ncbi:MAG: DUF4406 domain-containing protein [Lachnospiraceae bacterium]|nr:DUF4406 domain-containing protein [Lachnospiraceae bacterium]